MELEGANELKGKFHYLIDFIQLELSSRYIVTPSGTEYSGEEETICPPTDSFRTMETSASSTIHFQ